MSNRLENAIKTMMDIFEARGYSEVKESEDTDFPYITAISPKGESVCVFKNIIQKLNTDKVKNVIATLKNLKMSRGILIYEETPTPPVKNAIDNVPNTELTIELFSSQDLQFNITKHIYVPKHFKVVDAEELKNLKKEFKNGQLLPVLRTTDPITKFYGFCKGDIIRILRRDNTVAYRFVK